MSQYTEPTDTQLKAAEDAAAGVWQLGSNDDVWEAIMEPARSRFLENVEDYGDHINLVAELLPFIEAYKSFTAGDLTHEQVVTAIRKRFPLL